MNLELNNSVFETHSKRIFMGCHNTSMFEFVGNFEHIIQMIVWGHFESGLELYELNSLSKRFIKVKKNDIKNLLENYWVLEQLDEQNLQKCYEKLDVKK